MIECVGIGPGSLEYMTNLSTSLLKRADVVAGFDAVLNIVKPILPNECAVIGMSYKDQVEKLALVAAEHHSGKNCVVVFMGDIHFSGFQYLERVEKACGHKVKTIAGISSAQILASRARVCFDETTFITLHRRGDIEPFKKHMVSALQDERNVICIPRPWDAMPGDIAKFLIESGISTKHPVEIWENLTADESSWSGHLSDVKNKHSDMSIMLIRSLYPLGSQIHETEEKQA